jgi:hypothetical protein
VIFGGLKRVDFKGLKRGVFEGSKKGLKMVFFDDCDLLEVSR